MEIVNRMPGSQFYDIEIEQTFRHSIINASGQRDLFLRRSIFIFLIIFKSGSLFLAS